MLSSWNYRQTGAEEGSPLLGGWSQFVDDMNAGYRQTVLADGCTEIVWRNDEPAVVVGPRTTFRQGTLTPGLRLAGVRILPGHAALVLGVDADELAGQEVPLAELLPDRRRFAEPLRWAADPPAAAMAIDRVGPLVGSARRGPDRWTAAATGWLARHPTAPIASLADTFDVRPRQLHRRFTRAVGVSPKRFQRLMRLHRFVWLADALTDAGLAELAGRAGYADQAHLSREVQELAGQTPGQLRRDAYSRVSGSTLFGAPGRVSR